MRTTWGTVGNELDIVEGVHFEFKRAPYGLHRCGSRPALPGECFKIQRTVG